MRLQPGDHIALWRVVAGVRAVRGGGQGAGAVWILPTGGERARQREVGVRDVEWLGIVSLAQAQSLFEVTNGACRIALPQPGLAEPLKRIRNLVAGGAECARMMVSAAR